LCFFYFRYGKGPYYVQFTLSIQGENADSASSFVVELPSRKELPHSVFTFLTLVEYSLYHGTAFIAVNNNNTTDDHESTTSMSIGAKQPDSLSSAAVTLDQKFRALGFGNTALSFLEESLDTFPCGQHSVGFDGLGPTVEIFLSDNNASGRTCFGKIVRGMHTLSRVEAAVLEGQVVDIVKVQHLVM
jgi:cyclophilin family peptidyl-prolyl cis-trans isomerase